MKIAGGVKVWFDAFHAGVHPTAYHCGMQALFKLCVLSLFVLLPACNGAFKWDTGGPVVVGAVGLPPDQVNLGTESDAGPPATEASQGGTHHVAPSGAEIQAGKDASLMVWGIILMVAGIAAFVAHVKIPLIPSTLGVYLAGAGGALIAWASLSPSLRGWIVVGGIVVAVASVAWSVKHNVKLKDAFP